MAEEKKPARTIGFELYDEDEIINRPVKAFGNSSHIILPKKHAGKVAVIIVTDKIVDKKTGKEIEVKDEEE